MNADLIGVYPRKSAAKKSGCFYFFELSIEFWLISPRRAHPSQVNLLTPPLLTDSHNLGIHIASRKSTTPTTSPKFCNRLAKLSSAFLRAVNYPQLNNDRPSVVQTENAYAHCNKTTDALRRVARVSLSRLSSKFRIDCR